MEVEDIQAQNILFREQILDPSLANNNTYIEFSNTLSEKLFLTGNVSQMANIGNIKAVLDLYKPKNQLETLVEIDACLVLADNLIDPERTNRFNACKVIFNRVEDITRKGINQPLENTFDPDTLNGYYARRIIVGIDLINKLQKISEESNKLSEAGNQWLESTERKFSKLLKKVTAPAS